MNGIVYVLLEALNDEEEEAFRFLTVIVEDVLPAVFGGDIFGRDTLGATGKFFTELLQEVVPLLPEMCDAIGLPVVLFAYKWLPSLFSDVAFSGSGDRSLPFDTLLAAWDVCFLMGFEGASVVSSAPCTDLVSKCCQNFTL
jgi:hypothetical protein